MGSESRPLGKRGIRRLILIGLATAALVAVAPLASEPNPEYEQAQLFLDDMAAATVALRAGDSVPALPAAGDAVTWESATLPDGTVGSAVVGAHAGFCFVVFWQEPSDVGARAGVLDGTFPCEPTPGLFDAFPLPPLELAFPGTVPPLDAATLVKPAESRAQPQRVEPFPAERTRWWFVPAVIGLSALILSQLVGLALQRLPRNGARPQRRGKAPS